MLRDFNSDQPQIESRDDGDQKNHAVDMRAFQGRKHPKRFAHRGAYAQVVEPLQQSSEHKPLSRSIPGRHRVTQEDAQSSRTENASSMLELSSTGYANPIHRPA